ncbi:MAG TPA: ABC transporter permease [Anaerolineaceae bacterium]|nr:ABC transporter permease [Anaerolineaceae bacterium]
MEDKPIKNNKKNVGQIFLEEATGRGPKPKNRALGQTILIPVLAVFTGLVLGAIFILLTTVEVYTAFGKSFLDGLRVSWNTIAVAYSALWDGAIGNPAQIIAALHSGNQKDLINAFNPIMESLVATTPYIFAGLAVALGFRAGVFNIGAEGQLYMGAIFSVYAGYSIKGLPAIIHIPLALLAGALGGAVWGFIPGWLKAKTGAHEVINTIMMNYVAFHFSEWMLNGPMKRPGYDPISPTIQPSAMLPVFFPPPSRFHLGFFIALAFAYLVYWYLFKTTWGFELRTVGANLFAAKYAGMNISRNIILAMTLSGALAGLAGANEVLGVNHNLALSFSSGYGFNSIALALLGGSHPLGVVLASLLFGTLTNGATNMQVVAGIPIDIISVLQGFILAFVAAPAIIRTIYRLPTPSTEEELVSQSTGGD